MYNHYFNFDEAPFSIVPSAKLFYLSERHQEALNHLTHGLAHSGGFALLTVEVGTGKTAVSRALIAQFDQKTEAALILNPALSVIEILQTICDEYGLEVEKNSGIKTYNDALYQHLLKSSTLQKTKL